MRLGLTGEASTVLSVAGASRDVYKAEVHVGPGAGGLSIIITERPWSKFPQRARGGEECCAFADDHFP